MRDPDDSAGAQVDSSGAEEDEAGAEEKDPGAPGAPEEEPGDSGVAPEDEPGAQKDDPATEANSVETQADSAGAEDEQLAAQEGETETPQAEPGAQPGQGGAEEDEAEAPVGAKPTLHAGTLSSDMRLDGRLDEPTWSTADSIVNLITVEPKEGGVPAGQTTAKVLVTPSEIIIGVMCHDKNPGRIVSFSKARDAVLDQEDHVLIVLDPFHDGRSGYVFAVNPSGARFDGLVSAQGEEVNSNWDAVWEAKTWRGTDGWSAEIRIPVSSLSFKKGLADWGLNVQRRVQRLQETSRWSGASRDYEIYQTSHAGLLGNMPEFELGLGLSIRPAVVGGTKKLAPGSERDYTGDLSLDVTKKVGPNLLASATVNTDFAETEVDARQTNLTRFDIFFPEKRTFFLEGADIFEFGLGLEPEILAPFFSRRIGLFGQEDDLLEIPITVGGKVNGRLGNTNVAALAVRTGNVDSLGVPDATMGAVRIEQNVLSESSVGLLATFGDPLGRTDSWTAGMDVTYQTSHFLGDKNFHAGMWGLGNNRAGLEGDKFAYGGRIAYPNDVFDLGVTYIRIGDGFQPSLGFVPRIGTFLEAAGEVSARPPWAFLREMVHELSYFAVFDVNDRLESHLITVKPLDWLLESGDRFEFQIESEGERLTEPFDISDGVTIPTGSYQWMRYSVGGILAEKRGISGGATFSLGGFYEGDLATIELTLAVKPWPALLLEVSGERNSAKLPQGDFTEEVYSGRLEFRYSSDFQLSSLLQYDNESESLGSNTRLRWTFHPFGDLFVVFNHNLVRSIDHRFRFDSDELLVKLQYALRM